MSSLTNLLGITSTRDNDLATAQTNTAANQLGMAYGNYDTQNQGDLTQNATIGATNYYGNAQQVYGQQQQAANSLQAYANGTAPSAAQGQMLLGLGAANQQAQSAALSQQGGVMPGLTQRNMLMAQAQNSQNVLGQSAILRAQEQQQGTAAYNQVLGTMQNQQQQQGTLQLQQQQQALAAQAGLHAANLQAAQGTTQLRYGDQMGNINGQAAAAQAQASTLGQTIAGTAQALSSVPSVPGAKPG